MSQKVITADKGQAMFSITDNGTDATLGDIIAYNYDPHGHLPSNVSYQVAVSHGSVTTIKVEIYGSHDGTHFALLDTVQQTDAAWTAAGVLAGINSVPVPYLYAKLVSITGTGTPRVNVSFCV